METTIVEKLVGVTLIVVTFGALLWYHTMKDRRAARRRAAVAAGADGGTPPAPGPTPPAS